MSSERKLKILLLASWYTSQGYSQFGIIIQRQAEAVARMCRADF